MVINPSAVMARALRISGRVVQEMHCRTFAAPKDGNSRSNVSELRRNESAARFMSQMKRAHAVKTAGYWDSACAIDQVSLDAHERHRRRVVLTGERGTTFLLDLPQATALRDGDGLVLDDGGIVRIVGRPEPLIEIAATGSHELARLAWH